MILYLCISRQRYVSRTSLTNRCICAMEILFSRGSVCYFSSRLLPWSFENSKKNIVNKAWQCTIASEYFKYPVFPFMLESKKWILCIKNRKHTTIISFFNVHRTKIVTCSLIDIYFCATLFYLTLSVACNVFPSINW